MTDGRDTSGAPRADGLGRRAGRGEPRLHRVRARHRVRLRRRLPGGHFRRGARQLRIPARHLRARAVPLERAPRSVSHARAQRRSAAHAAPGRTNPQRVGSDVGIEPALDRIALRGRRAARHRFARRARGLAGQLGRARRHAHVASRRRIVGGRRARADSRDGRHRVPRKWMPRATCRSSRRPRASRLRSARQKPPRRTNEAIGRARSSSTRRTAPSSTR